MPLIDAYQGVATNDGYSYGDKKEAWPICLYKKFQHYASFGFDTSPT